MESDRHEMARHFGPAGGIGGARARDRTLGYPEAKRLLGFPEGDGHWDSAELLNKLRERLVVDPGLLAREVAVPASLRRAEQHLRAEGPQPEQLGGVAGLKPLNKLR